MSTFLSISPGNEFFRFMKKFAATVTVEMYF